MRRGDRALHLFAMAALGAGCALLIAAILGAVL